jgi:hypothetical protein
VPSGENQSLEVQTRHQKFPNTQTGYPRVTLHPQTPTTGPKKPTTSPPSPHLTRGLRSLCISSATSPRVSPQSYTTTQTKLRNTPSSTPSSSPTTPSSPITPRTTLTAARKRTWRRPGGSTSSRAMAAIATSKSALMTPISTSKLSSAACLSAGYGLLASMRVLLRSWGLRLGRTFQGRG